MCACTFSLSSNFGYRMFPIFRWFMVFVYCTKWDRENALEKTNKPLIYKNQYILWKKYYLNYQKKIAIDILEMKMYTELHVFFF